MRQSRVKILQGLKRVEGQVRGIQKMVDEDRYCVDVLLQLRAAKAALHRLEGLVLREHIAGCVVEAIESGDPVERQEKIGELIETVSKITG